MNVVMTIVVRDEADIVGDQIRYHLEQGVDFVVATDHRSVDATTAILRAFERAGRLHLIRRDDEGFHQGEWTTEMARFAAAELGADWVIHADADEFWWPRTGSLPEILAAVPAPFGVVRGLWRHFVLRPDGGESFYERMTVRRLPAVDWTSPYNVQVKVAHRADPGVTVPRGSHDAWGDRLRLIREWFPFEILHFPIRTRAQLLQKYADADAYEAGAYRKVPRHTAAMAARLRGDADELYDSVVARDEEVARGLGDGTLALDTRLRDFLRGDTEECRPSPAEELALAKEIDTFLAGDSARRLGPRSEAFEHRLAAVEARYRR
jgi:Glycosyl transferase family 2